MLATLAWIVGCVYGRSDRWQSSCAAFHAQYCSPDSPLGQFGVSTGLLMPQPGDPNPPSLSTEDAFLELLTDTLESMERPARGPFLEKFLKSMSHVDINEATSLDIWYPILPRTRHLSQNP